MVRAPKVRCMQIIAELEGEGRGPYTGAMGYLGTNGDMDLNILIRSAWLAGNEAQLRAGAGLVVDSQPNAELEETRAKARGLLRAHHGDAVGREPHHGVFVAGEADPAGRDAAGERTLDPFLRTIGETAEGADLGETHAL